MNKPLGLHVVDGSSEAHCLVRRLFCCASFNIKSHTSAEEFLDSADLGAPFCVVTELHLGGMTGIDLLCRLGGKNRDRAVIVSTSIDDIASAVAVMRAGAFHLLQKPVAPNLLVSAVENAKQHIARNAAASAEHREIDARYALLSQRERQVLYLVSNGLPSKLIAYELGISCRTAEHHRDAVRKKMRAETLAHLIRMFFVLRSSDTGLSFESSMEIEANRFRPGVRRARDDRSQEICS